MFDISKMSLRQKINQTIVVLMEKDKKIDFCPVCTIDDNVTYFAYSKESQTTKRNIALLIL